MKELSLAIEKGYRILSEDYLNYFDFVVVQLKFFKSEIISGDYSFEYWNNDVLYYSQKFNLNTENGNIIAFDSHEDPLIQSEECYFICSQLTSKLITEMPELITIKFIHLKNNKIIKKIELNVDDIKNNYINNYKCISSINEFDVISKKDCTLRIHLGDSNMNYKEDEFILKKDTLFNFENYLKDYEYVAIQCSYEDEPVEIEEKNFIIGQKSTTNTSMYFDDMFIYSLLPYKFKYQKLFYKDVPPENKQDFYSSSQKSWNLIKNINELIQFHQKNPIYLKNLFEINWIFIEKNYRTKNTYGIGKTYNKNLDRKKIHIDNDVCQTCINKSKCMQLIPSSLSYELFKRNIIVDNFRNCDIFKLIENKGTI